MTTDLSYLTLWQKRIIMALGVLAVCTIVMQHEDAAVAPPIQSATGLRFDPKFLEEQKAAQAPLMRCAEKIGAKVVDKEYFDCLAKFNAMFHAIDAARR